ncbi:MAG: fasciclin domain-containing protein [Prevotella sp.]
MKRILSCITVLLFAVAGVLSSCSSNVEGDNYYTFTGETVSSYCANHDSTSIFSKIIQDAGLSDLLSTYGHYTSFIPTDSAFEVYFKSRSITYDDLTDSDKVNIVYNHIIRSTTTEYLTTDFTEGALKTANMNNRFIVISYQKNDLGSNDILVNKVAKIIQRDIELHNGVVHLIDHVLVPSDETLGNVISQYPQFSLFSEAFDLTHLNDSILESYDMSYECPYTSEYTNVLGYSMKTIQQKKLGYTLFAEPDSVFHAAGINSIETLVEFASKYYGTEDMDDYTSRNNPLNKFISYHLLDRQMSTNSFIYSGPNTTTAGMNERYEYYETMLQYRLIQFKAGNQINTLKDGTYVGIDESQSNISGMNGFIHCLTDILVYDEDNMVNDVLNKRMRFDPYSVPPELTNNNIRWSLTSYTMTPEFCGEYFKFNDATKFIMWGSNYWDDYQADEMSIRGWYDFTMRMIPVPPGTYEIRLGYSTRAWGGLAQIFIDGDIIGIPIDFKTNGKDPKIGWVADDETTDNGVENDRIMRNRGYMKGPASAQNWGYSVTLRNASDCLRVILGTFTFQEYGPHYFRAKNIESELGEFHFDYMEYVPVDVLDNEDRN